MQLCAAHDPPPTCLGGCAGRPYRSNERRTQFATKIQRRRHPPSLSSARLLPAGALRHRCVCVHPKAVHNAAHVLISPRRTSFSSLSRLGYLTRWAYTTRCVSAQPAVSTLTDTARRADPHRRAMEPATINASVLWERMAAWDEELRGEKPAERPQVTYGTHLCFANSVARRRAHPPPRLSRSHRKPLALSRPVSTATASRTRAPR